MPELIGSFFVLKVITLLSLTVFGVMIYETWHPCYSGDTQPPGLSCRIFGAHLPFSINRINLHILSAQRCALRIITKIALLSRPARYVIWHQKGSTSQDGDFKSPKHE